MPEIKEKNITALRDGIYASMKENSVIPVIYDGEFAGVMITCGELDAKTKARLRGRIKFNHKDAVNEILDKQ
jgi:hypothetical protein